jgi:hypothetical protein
MNNHWILTMIGGVSEEAPDDYDSPSEDAANGYNSLSDDAPDGYDNPSERCTLWLQQPE